MSNCPKCGFDLDKNTKPQNKPWIDFDFNNENFSAFKLILERTISYSRLHIYAEMEKPEMLEYLGPPRKPLPFDVWAKFNTIRSANITLIYSILEFFHKTKKCPPGKFLRDIKIFTRLEKLRHFCAHIINDDGKLMDALIQFRELKVEVTFTKVSEELFKFVIAGIDKYLEMGLLHRRELENAAEAKVFLDSVDFRRAKKKS